MSLCILFCVVQCSWWHHGLPCCQPGGGGGGGGRSRQWISGYWRPGNPYLAQASHSQLVVSQDMAGGGGALSLSPDN